ncbi:MAG: hypothetical protein M0Z77_01030 [Thermoplasmatales archaeon]|nr:hypothetical protein [Candidatus Thermoplasmatota archaeon]MCL6002924.1 hypothetical protein [Candidatus Thermoplasmatota archaeon]MDA8054218.1 hypothetical protein [Thermoplasmatales archaeon]
METFDRGKYVIADFTRGKAMLAAFFVAAFLGFLSGLLPATAGYVGVLLLFVVLIIAVYLMYRSGHETKKKSDYFIAFFVSLLAFLGFWIISLNIP